MQFAKPEMLMGLWGIVILAGFLFWALQRKSFRTRQFAHPDSLKEIAATFHPERQVLKYGILIGVFILSILALARPQWGFEWQEVNRKGLDILVIVDTSKSMLTEDVKPNRLERTKFAVKDLIKKLKGDRIGLMAFSGTSFLVCPLTIDYGGFLLALEDLTTDTIPRGGTNIAGAIKDAIQKYEKVPTQFKAVILITDGESLEGDPVAAAHEAKNKGIKIYSIGIGTQEGELIQLPIEQGAQEFLKDSDGNFVKSRLNEGLLQEIAKTTGGVYVRASGAQFGLDYIYDEHISKMEKREFESKMERKFHERFQIPLGLAFVLLVWETWLTTRKEI